MIPSEHARMHRFLDEGLSKSEAARRLGRCRQTIYNWLQEEHEALPPKARRRSKLDPHKPYIESRLQLFDLPATVLLEEIRAKGYEGKITILRDFVAGVKQREVRRVVERFETEPGRQAQVDWASCGTIVHKGRRRRLSLLVVVLGHSRVTWARFVVSERRPVLLRHLERAFRELGGVPRELLVDNMKQAIDLVRTADREAKVNEEFQRFADHWGFEVVACPPYWPRAKGQGRAGDPVHRAELSRRASLHQSRRPQCSARRLARRDRQRPDPRHHQGPAGRPTVGRPGGHASPRRGALPGGGAGPAPGRPRRLPLLLRGALLGQPVGPRSSPGRAGRGPCRHRRAA